MSLLTKYIKCLRNMILQWKQWSLINTCSPNQMKTTERGQVELEGEIFSFVSSSLTPFLSFLYLSCICFLLKNFRKLLNGSSTSEIEHCAT